MPFSRMILADQVAEAAALAAFDTRLDAVEDNEAWVLFTLLNGWVEYPPYTPGYRRLSNGLVVLRGLLDNGSATSEIFASMPGGVGLRPSQDWVPLARVGASQDDTGLLSLGSLDGVFQRISGGGQFVGLDGLSYLGEI